MSRSAAIAWGLFATGAVAFWFYSGTGDAGPGAGSAVPPERAIPAREEEPYSPLRGTIRATFRTNLTVTTWKSGELRGGLAILAVWRYADRDFDGCYWMGPTGTLYAANGDAKMYSPSLPWSPVGIDYYSVMAAARYGLADGAVRAMRSRAQATLDAAKRP